MRRGPVAVEIHWTIASPDARLTIDEAPLWQRATPIVVGANGASTLCPEDLLLHLCLHATHEHHMEMGLRALCDVAAVAQRHGSEIDWSRIARRAREWQCHRGVYLTLELSRQLLGAPVPREVVALLRPPAANCDQVIATAAMHLFASPDQPRSGDWELSRLIAPQPFRSRLSHLLNRVVLPSHRLAASYGFDHAAPWHVHLRYQLLRIVHLFQRHSRTALRLLLKSDPETVLRAQRQNALGDWLAARDPE